MVKARIRLGTRVREFTLPHIPNVTINDVEDYVAALIKREYQLVGFSLEYLGCVTWSIMVDGHKVGHIHAWDETITPSAPPVNNLFAPEAIIN